jgi:hypothetical protein
MHHGPVGLVATVNLISLRSGFDSQQAHHEDNMIKNDDHILDEDGKLGDVLVTAEGKIIITWPGGSTDEYDTEAELQEVIDYEGYLEVVSSELASDFEKIKAKYVEAARLINEANDVAAKHGIVFEGYKYFDTCGIGDLFDALSSAGWSTSSMMC